jgi:hypothetical protein
LGNSPLEKDGVAVSLQQNVCFSFFQKKNFFLKKKKDPSQKFFFKKKERKKSPLVWQSGNITQLFWFVFFWYFIDRKNDPAAGSPTATLLRLLLPLLKKCR